MTTNKELEQGDSLWRFIMYFFGGCLFCIVVLVMYLKMTSKMELEEIRRDLESIDGVRVLNIRGHYEVFSIEEIEARLEIKGKGEILLTSLSSDVFRYPNIVSIAEINNVRFINYHCTDISNNESAKKHSPGLDCVFGYGGSLNVGKDGPFHKELGVVFLAPKDVVANFDKIEELIGTIPEFPKMMHNQIKDDQEIFIGKVNNRTDIDSLLNLEGIGDSQHHAKTLDWTNKKCISRLY